MKRALAILLVVLFAFGIAVPAFAEGEHTCDHDATTIESLHHCVMHAAEMGHITKPGVAASLMDKLDAAQTAYDSGNTTEAVSDLKSFIKSVKAQTGKAIDAEHAAHLIEHANNVIAAISG